MTPRTHGPELNLICVEGLSPELRQKYREFLEEKASEWPESEATEVGPEGSGGRRLDFSWLKDSVPEAVDNERIETIFSPDGGGDCYIRDRAAIQSLLEVFQDARGGYLKREAETRPAPDRRTVSPEQRFEMEYIAPMEFALRHDECAIGMVF